MRRDNRLEAITPNPLDKLLSYTLRHLRRDFHVFEADVPVICLDAICFSKLLFDRHKLISGAGRIAVDSLNIVFALRFFFVLSIGEYITERLILFFEIGFNRP